MVAKIDKNAGGVSTLAKYIKELKAKLEVLENQKPAIDETVIEQKTTEICQKMIENMENNIIEKVKQTLAGEIENQLTESIMKNVDQQVQKGKYCVLKLRYRR